VAEPQERQQRKKAVRKSRNNTPAAATMQQVADAPAPALEDVADAPAPALEDVADAAAPALEDEDSFGGLQEGRPESMEDILTGDLLLDDQQNAAGFMARNDFGFPGPLQESDGSVEERVRTLLPQYQPAQARMISRLQLFIPSTDTFKQAPAPPFPQELNNGQSSSAAAAPDTSNIDPMLLNWGNDVNWSGLDMGMSMDLSQETLEDLMAGFPAVDTDMSA